MERNKGLMHVAGLIRLSAFLLVAIPILSWGDTDEILDLPIEGNGSSD